LLTAQLASQSNLIRLRSAQRANRIRLYQALGSSFDAVPATASVALSRP
jgi:outer membrane protein TolC